MNLGSLIFPEYSKLVLFLFALSTYNLNQSFTFLFLMPINGIFVLVLNIDSRRFHIIFVLYSILILGEI